MTEALQVWLQKEESRERISRPELPLWNQATMAHQLQVMFNSGIPLTACFEALAKGEPQPEVESYLRSVTKSLGEGQTLSESLDTGAFRLNRDFVCAIALGEQTGALALVLREIAKELEAELELRQKVRQSMIYPAFLMGISFLGLAVLLYFFAPQLAALSGPLAKESALFNVVLGVIQVIVDPWFIAGSIMVVMGLIQYLKSQDGFRKLSALLYLLPGLSRVHIQTVHIRIATTLLTLLRSGSMLAPALLFIQRNLAEPVAAERLGEVHKGLVDGEELIAAFQRSSFFEPTFLAFIEAGETSGTLEKMLDSYVRLSKVRLETSVESLVSLLEPLVLTTVGVVIGGLTVALFLPMARYVATL